VRTLATLAFTGSVGCGNGSGQPPRGTAGVGTMLGAAATSGSLAMGGAPATGGNATGGNATGGNATGGNATGGNATGGNATGGNAMGAPATGGNGTSGNGTSGTLGSGGALATAGAGNLNGGHGGDGNIGDGGASTAGAGTAGSWPSGDEFEGTVLDPSWTVFRSDLADLAIADGALSITPKPKDLWYQASQGVLVYKLVTGDFKVTATVHARKASDRATAPAEFADVGGLMARNPSGDSENYVLGVVGYAEMNELAIEHKSTTDSQSEYGETAFGSDAELRLCRTGGSFTIYYREPGASGWPTSVAPIERADLPQTLQVGMIAYTGASSPDYVSIFDRIAFEPVGAACDE
jgi:hypothetical protein